MILIPPRRRLRQLLPTIVQGPRRCNFSRNRANFRQDPHHPTLPSAAPCSDCSDHVPIILDFYDLVCFQIRSRLTCPSIHVPWRCLQLEVNSLVFPWALHSSSHINVGGSSIYIPPTTGHIIRGCFKPLMYTSGMCTALAIGQRECQLCQAQIRRVKSRTQWSQTHTVPQSTMYPGKAARCNAPFTKPMAELTSCRLRPVTHSLQMSDPLDDLAGDTAASLPLRATP